MKFSVIFRPLSALVFAVGSMALGSAAASHAPAGSARAATVTVSYADPQHFTEKKRYGSEDRFNDVDYLTQLRTYIVKQAARLLGPGQRLAVTVTDIKLAGGFEPWRGPNWQNVRFMTDIYPPRIDLRFTLTDSHGRVLKQGSRKLSDMSYLISGSSAFDSGPLHYDKALLRRWLTRELRQP